MCSPAENARIGRAALLAALFLVALCPGVQPALAQDGGAEQVPALEVSARAWAVTDLRTGEYLAGSGASEPLWMASTTKVMGALVAFETDLDEELTVSEEAAYAVPAYSNVGLLAGTGSAPGSC